MGKYFCHTLHSKESLTYSRSALIQHDFITFTDINLILPVVTLIKVVELIETRDKKGRCLRNTMIILSLTAYTTATLKSFSIF